jgi:hypothetical protein
VREIRLTKANDDRLVALAGGATKVDAYLALLIGREAQRAKTPTAPDDYTPVPGLERP